MICLIYCDNCTYIVHDDSSEFCPNCGVRLRSNLTVPLRTNSKSSYRRYHNRDWFKIYLSVLIIISTMLIASSLVLLATYNPSAHKATSTLEKPVLESVHSIKAFHEDSTQNFDYFNNSVFFVQNNPISVVKMTFDANQNSIVATKVYPLINASLSLTDSIMKFTTNAKISFALVHDLDTSIIYEIRGPTTNGSYIMENPINLTCEEPNMYSASSTFCRITDIKVIGNDLYEVAFYVQKSDSQTLGNILKEYNLKTNKTVKVYSLPNQQSTSIGIAETDEYLGINEGNASNQLLLNYENVISIETGLLGSTNWGFFKLDEGSTTFQNTIQYIFSSSTNAQLSNSRTTLSNMMYVNKRFLIFYYNQISNQLFQFAKYKLENVGSSNNVTIDI